MIDFFALFDLTEEEIDELLPEGGWIDGSD